MPAFNCFCCGLWIWQALSDEWTPNSKRISSFSSGLAPANTSRTCDIDSLILQVRDFKVLVHTLA